MGNKKLESAFIMFGFGLAYVFFGLTLIIDLLPDYTKIATGMGALVIGTIFLLWAIFKFVKK